jgi:glutamine synthetase
MWTTELYSRIVPENADIVRQCVKLHDDGDCSDTDVHNWAIVQGLRRSLLQSTLDQPSLFARLRSEIKAQNFEEISNLQLEVSQKMLELRDRYADYRRNLLHNSH